jgi:hypothetical protein
MTLFQSKMDFLSANSRFAVQNDGTYIPRITRETCIHEDLLITEQLSVKQMYHCFRRKAKDDCCLCQESSVNDVTQFLTFFWRPQRGQQALSV